MINRFSWFLTVFSKINLFCNMMILKQDRIHNFNLFFIVIFTLRIFFRFNAFLNYKLSLYIIWSEILKIILNIKLISILRTNHRIRSIPNTIVINIFKPFKIFFRTICSLNRFINFDNHFIIWLTFNIFHNLPISIKIFLKFIKVNRNWHHSFRIDHHKIRQNISWTKIDFFPFFKIGGHHTCTICIKLSCVYVKYLCTDI